MLKALYTNNNIDILWWEANKSDKPFFCPGCKEEVILKQWIEKADHFAHKITSSCTYWEGETYEHMICKKTLYEELSKNTNITELQIDKIIWSLIPNISFVYKHKKVVIEILKSDYSGLKIIEKSMEYTDMNIYVLWLVTYNDWLNEDTYNRSQMEKVLHQIYGWRVLYWTDWLNILPIHFEDEYRDIPSTDWWWWYSKAYINKKNPLPWEKINLVNDFVFSDTTPFNKGNFPTPPLKLFMNWDTKWR